MRKLPPLRSLQVFEAAARLQHFSRAGEELCISQSAVSHQIRQLEEYFETPLFQRKSKQLQLSDKGRLLAEELHGSLNHLAELCQQIKGEKRHEIRLALYSSFAVKWLIPRLSDFRRQNPLIKIRLEMMSQDPELSETVADIFITGRTAPKGYWHHTLHQERLIAVCAPHLLPQHLAATTEVFQQQTLLAVDEGPIGIDWQRWSETNDMPLSDTQSIQVFSHMLLAMEAAIAGLGIALVSDFIVQGDIDNGRLIALEWPDIHTGFQFNLCCKSRRRNEADIHAFTQWLINQAEAL
ncbi:LysR substrate-binding domain-containing protein [Shewanella sp. NFH-SH190041]|uniref:LysR substrate-binding domain-containing protein n=1 Tax=Shewanella sp. NFH-SH190041 TaxID=2950245 RepID=UPI0021C34C87|nr:LysR substrate-binding domain-containing protein [Shewanella sp. NFH-SH190041]